MNKTLVPDIKTPEKCPKNIMKNIKNPEQPNPRELEEHEEEELKRELTYLFEISVAPF